MLIRGLSVCLLGMLNRREPRGYFEEGDEGRVNYSSERNEVCLQKFYVASNKERQYAHCYLITKHEGTFFCKIALDFLGKLYQKLELTSRQRDK